FCKSPSVKESESSSRTRRPKGPIKPNSYSLRSNRGFSYEAFGTCRGSARKRVGGLIEILFSASTKPVRKVTEEMCPSPVARKLRIKRKEPGGRLDWSG